MINLLLAPPDETALAAILAETAGRPPLPPLGDAAWSAAAAHPVVRSWLPRLLALAAAEADEPLPALPDELYADFFRTGERLPFERPYFERRRRLGRAAMALALAQTDADRARFQSSFVRKLGELMAEDSWTLPAHVWDKPSGKDPMVIDLFAAETANHLAELLAVFAAVIPAALVAAIRLRLREQIFENFVRRDPPFFWTTSPMNWNAVCHQGVLGAALTVEDDHALVARMLARAARGLPRFLDGFGDDGSTSEGPGYWSYGFGWFTELNAQLEHRTAGRLSLFEGNDKVARIARFAPRMVLAKGHLVNFSDGGHRGRLNPPTLRYLGQRLADPVVAAEGSALYRHQAEAGLDFDELRRDFFNLSRQALRLPPAADVAAAAEPARPDVFFDDYGAIVARGTDRAGRLWELAAKGGHNAEHHNHNDCGSFLLNLDGSPALLEIGAPEYVHDFFNGAKRYTFLAARSLGHSVPFVNGREQPEGRDFAARVLEATLAPEHARFVVDLTACYPAEAGCARLVRSFDFDKVEGRLVVSDDYALAAPGEIESILICPDGAVTRDGSAMRVRTAAGGLLRIEPGAGCVWGEPERCDYSDHHGRPAAVTRLRLRPASTPAREGSLVFVVTATR